MHKILATNSKNTHTHTPSHTRCQTLVNKIITQVKYFSTFGSPHSALDSMCIAHLIDFDSEVFPDSPSFSRLFYSLLHSKIQIFAVSASKNGIFCRFTLPNTHTHTVILHHLISGFGAGNLTWPA